MSVLTDLIYGGSNAVAGLTEGAVNDAIAKFGADIPLTSPIPLTISPPSTPPPASRSRPWATWYPA